MQWHTLALNSFNVVWLDNFAWLVFNSDFSVIQVCDNKINSSQCLKEGYFLFEHQVSAFSFEKFMFLFDYLNDDIAWFHIRKFVCLTMEDILLPVGSSLVNLNIKHLLFLNDFLTVAVLAFVLLINFFALTMAIIAWSSTLLIHSWSQHLHFSSHTSALATTASLYSAWLAS